MKKAIIQVITLCIASVFLMSFTSSEGSNSETSVSAPVSGASITGTITYSGAVPKMRAIKMGAEPSCHAKHSPPAVSQALVLGDDNMMANVFVRVKSGLPAGKTSPAPSTPVTGDQSGCICEPHV